MKRQIIGKEKQKGVPQCTTPLENPYHPTEEIKLNIGAGDFPIKGFVNIDVYEGPNIDLVCNAIKLPYKDNSIDFIYCGHCIEHLTIKEAREGLKEWLRILKSGCSIGIVVPEKDLTPKHMIDGDKVPNKPYKSHHSYWDLEMLKKETINAGFVDIEEINIDTYPYLVSRPKWQVGITARKFGKIKKELKDNIEIPKFNPREESWCKHENKVVYNPTKKLHCPYCKYLLEDINDILPYTKG
jgi:predicted SAM-dependent methyltransferase